MLADRYRNISQRHWFTRLFPGVECGLGLIIHAHFDHDAAERLPEGASLFRMPGELVNRDMTVRGVLDLHAGASRLRDFPNVMLRLETGGISFLHLGGNRADWPADVASSIGDIDVLLVTVDGSNHLLSYEEGWLSGPASGTKGGGSDALSDTGVDGRRYRPGASGGLAGHPAKGQAAGWPRRRVFSSESAMPERSLALPAVARILRQPGGSPVGAVPRSAPLLQFSGHRVRTGHTIVPHPGQHRRHPQGGRAQRPGVLGDLGLFPRGDRSLQAGQRHLRGGPLPRGPGRARPLGGSPRLEGASWWKRAVVFKHRTV